MWTHIFSIADKHDQTKIYDIWKNTDEQGAYYQAVISPSKKPSELDSGDRCLSSLLKTKNL
jgi:hypothetical protein